MPNQLTKDLEILFEEVVEGYDADCVISKAVEKRYPEPKAMQRAGETLYVSQDYQATSVDGLDISAAANTDLIQRMIPLTFRQPRNVKYELDAKEMRDDLHKRRMGEAARRHLAGHIDQAIYDLVAQRAGIVIKKVGAFTWDDAANAEVQLFMRGIASNRDKKLFLNPVDYLSVAKDLGNRSYVPDLTKTAIEQARVPNIGSFETYRTDNVSNVVAPTAAVTGITVLATASHTPSAMTGDIPTDNRQMTLTLAGANLANLKNGDAFTLPGVNAVHMETKSDTGQPFTFRILSGGGTASVVVTPAPVLTGPYQNVTAAPTAGMAVTVLNTATKPVNVFWKQGAVELLYGRLAFPTGEGPQVMTATTKQGVPLLMSYSFNHLTGKTSVRFTVMFGTAVLCPEHCGIVIANQV
jgi:hypothetical protein